MFCIFKALIVEQEETANLLSLCLGNLLTCRILRSVTGSHYLEKKKHENAQIYDNTKSRTSIAPFAATEQSSSELGKRSVCC